MFVTMKDALAIRKVTGKSFAQFLDYSPLPKRIIAALSYDDPAFEGGLRYSQLSRGRLLRLRTKRDGRCIFLNDFGKCDIYKVRPNVCRIFPFWVVKLISGRLKIISHDADPECKMVKGQEDVEKLLSKKQVAEIKRIFRKIRKESCAVNFKKSR